MLLYFLNTETFFLDASAWHFTVVRNNLVRLSEKRTSQGLFIYCLLLFLTQYEKAISTCDMSLGFYGSVITKIKLSLLHCFGF